MCLVNWNFKLSASIIIDFSPLYFITVSLHKGKSELASHAAHLHDNQFRNRDLTVFDSPVLDGECFLQVS